MQQHVANWGQIVFFLGLALLATHELDAMTHKEWRLLPILDQLDDDKARAAFVLLHIPLFWVLFFLTSSKSPSVRTVVQIGVSLFLVAHAIIHFNLSGHALYEFQAPIETITVYGGAIAGALFLVLVLVGRSATDHAADPV